jgi:hypothetical protein
MASIFFMARRSSRVGIHESVAAHPGKAATELPIAGIVPNAWRRGFRAKPLIGKETKKYAATRCAAGVPKK